MPQQGGTVGAQPGILELHVPYVKAAADAMASTATAADYFFSPSRPMELVDAKFISAGTLTSNDTAYASIIVNKHDGAGGAGTPMCQGDTKTTSGGGGGNLAAGVAYNLPISATEANRQIAPNQVCSFQITKTGAGVVVPAGWLSLKFRLINS